MGRVSRMGRIMLLLISTALAAPQGNNSDSSGYLDYSGIIYERSAISNSLVEDRAINTCGCAPVSSTDRIVGGKEVNPKGKLPYQVMFFPCAPSGQCGLCGGTIVNKKFVITAAHYWDSMMTNLRVIVGEHNVFCDGVNEGGKVINVKKATMHPDYNIAVLELSEELTFTDKIRPACLPSSASKDYSGTASTISGWGGTIGYGPKDQQPKQPTQCGLKESMVKILGAKDEKCTRVLRTRSDPSGTAKSNIKMCAWAKDTDTCQGDSGGPLTVPENGKYTLVGVVSYGWGCASSTPGIYARVQGFLPWIKNLISSGECSGSSSSSGATTAKPTTAKPTTTASSNGNYDD